MDRDSLSREIGHFRVGDLLTFQGGLSIKKEFLWNAYAFSHACSLPTLLEILFAFAPVCTLLQVRSSLQWFGGGLMPQELYTLEEVATRFRVSDRKMREVVQQYPFYRAIGRR